MEKEILSRFSKEEILQAEQNADRFMEGVKANSVVSTERPNRIRQLIFEGSLGVKVPIIANWICPRGTPLIPDEETNRLYRRYTSISPEEGFATDYQILPRIELEKKLCRNLERFSTGAMYLKIVADNNPACLYPACFRIDGEGTTMDSISKYAKYCQNQFDTLIPRGEINVETWSALLGKNLFREYLKEYENISLKDLMPFLPNNIVETEIDILTDHTKPDLEVLPYFKTFASDCIRYFAVEGLFLNKIFKDDVVLAWNDSTRITQTIDALRKKRGLPALPKIYVLHEKRNRKIKDDF